MWLPFLGLFTGILLGSIFTFTVPVIYAKYLSIAVLAALDSLIGGWRALLEDKFDSPILISGFFTNTLLAAGLAYLGDSLGLDLYLAAVITFGLRIFSNLGFIRRYIISKYKERLANAPKKSRKTAANHKNHPADPPLLSILSPDDKISPPEEEEHNIIHEKLQDAIINTDPAVIHEIETENTNENKDVLSPIIDINNNIPSNQENDPKDN